MCDDHGWHRWRRCVYTDDPRNGVELSMGLKPTFRKITFSPERLCKNNRGFYSSVEISPRLYYRTLFPWGLQPSAFSLRTFETALEAHQVQGGAFICFLLVVKNYSISL